MSALPAAPVLGTSFTAISTNTPSAQQPGTNLDAEFNRTNAAVAQILTFLATALNADGTLKSSAVAAAGGAPGNPGGTGTNLANAPSALSAQLAQAWAEYMPGTIPAETLAGTAITGDHNSSRWWANAAAQLTLTAEQVVNAAVSTFAQSLQGQLASGALTLNVAPVVVPLTPFNTNPSTGAAGYINGTRTVFALTRADTNAAVAPANAAGLFVFLNGVPKQPGVDFTVSGSNITFAVAPTLGVTEWAVWVAPDINLALIGGALNYSATTTGVFDGGIVENGAVTATIHDGGTY
jgi:hypothetical protein